MAVKTKTQLHADTAALPAPITRVALIGVLDDMIDSYEDFVVSYTTVQRDALTPTAGDLIYNTDNDRVEYYNGTAWIAASQKPVVAVNCSANPDYQEASVGDQYIVSVAGKIGGASGLSVYVGDMIYCTVKNAGGTQASVGTSWGICHSQSVSDSPTYYAEVSLTSADILALNSTPITLVAAPGAGKIIVPVSILTQFTYSTAAYTTNTNGRVYYATGALYVSVLDLSAVASYNFLNRSGDFYPIADKALMLAEPSGAPAAGSGTAKVGVYYKIHTL
jgi:hypothetical protein